MIIDISYFDEILYDTQVRSFYVLQRQCQLILVRLGTANRASLTSSGVPARVTSLLLDPPQLRDGSVSTRHQYLGADTQDAVKSLYRRQLKARPSKTATIALIPTVLERVAGRIGRNTGKLAYFPGSDRCVAK